MSSFFDKVRDRARASIERERGLDGRLETISLVLWPYSEARLAFYVVLMAFLDYVSTFAALDLSGNTQVYEAGLVAKWALQTGGFPRLFVADIVMIGTLVCLAVGFRLLYTKLGFQGFGRAAFVLLLTPYFVFITGVVVHNVLVSFL